MFLLVLKEFWLLFQRFVLEITEYTRRLWRGRSCKSLGLSRVVESKTSEAVFPSDPSNDQKARKVLVSSFGSGWLARNRWWPVCSSLAYWWVSLSNQRLYRVQFQAPRNLQANLTWVKRLRWQFYKLRLEFWSEDPTVKFTSIKITAYRYPLWLRVPVWSTR